MTTTSCSKLALHQTYLDFGITVENKLPSTMRRDAMLKELSTLVRKTLNTFQCLIWMGAIIESNAFVVLTLPEGG
jgi:hypothetical protein